jgi:hypothetical protein
VSDTETSIVVEASETNEADLVLHLAVRKGADLEITEEALRREFEAFMWRVTELLTTS